VRSSNGRNLFEQETALVGKASGKRRARCSWLLDAVRTLAQRLVRPRGRQGAAKANEVVDSHANLFERHGVSPQHPVSRVHSLARMSAGARSRLTARSVRPIGAIGAAVIGALTIAVLVDGGSGEQAPSSRATRHPGVDSQLAAARRRRNGRTDAHAEKTARSVEPAENRAHEAGRRPHRRPRSLTMPEPPPSQPADDPVPAPAPVSPSVDQETEPSPVTPSYTYSPPPSPPPPAPAPSSASEFGFEQ
jgi:hypothetical protein